MSIRNCIRNLRTAGHITSEEASRLEKRYQSLLRDVQSPGAARDRMIGELEAEKIEKRRLSLLTETARQRIDLDLDAYRDRQGRHNRGEATMRLLEHQGQAPYADVETTRKSILGMAHAELDDLLHEFRRGAVLGDKRRQMNSGVSVRLDNVVRELFGEASADVKAGELAGAWTKVADGLRQRFNAAGGSVGKLEKWGLPQQHSAEALASTGFQEWRNFVHPRLDLERMRSSLTGERLTPDELDAGLNVMFDRIVTDGWIDKEPSGATQGQGALATRHADHRFLHFKGADAWLEYQRAFGEGDPFAAMMGHLSTMARDIAAMEVLGPNPGSTLTYLKERINQSAQLAGRDVFDRELGTRIGVHQATDPVPSVDEARRSVARIDDMWAHISGSASAPVGTRIANTMAGARNLVSAASLGSATLSAVSDAGFGIMARLINGMPATRLVGQYIRQFGTENTREAVRASLILDSALNAVGQQARYLGTMSGRGVTSYINDRVLTYSGLQAWTQAGKHAFGLEFQGFVADNAGHGWSELPAALRDTLNRHGFDSASWERIRTSPLYEPERGATLLRPAEIAASVDRGLGEKYLRMILRETLAAVPETTVQARSGMIGTNQPGTLIGEVLRAAGQFKAFGVTVMMLQASQIQRAAAANGAIGGAAYAGSMLIATMLLGGVAMQLKNIAAGRDPQSMKPLEAQGAKFWGAAVLQGGGLGIFGDFLFSDVNRVGGSWAKTMGGPLLDRAETAWRLTGGNVIEVAQGKDKTNAGREAVNGLRQWVPGSSLWYMRLAWERVVIDQLQHLADPDAHSAFRRRVESRQREYGQEFWWRPGESRPERGPDPARMLGQK